MTGWEYICFSTLGLKSNEWKIIEIGQEGLSDKKLSRKVKIRFDQYLPDHELSIHLDSKFHPGINLDKFVREYPGNLDFAMMNHKKRSHIFEEARFLIDKKIGDPNLIKKQINRYKKMGVSKSTGLYAPGIMVRRNNKRVIDCMKFWFDEVMAYSYRDTLSVSVALWKFPVWFKSIPYNLAYPIFMNRKKKHIYSL